MKDGLQEGQCLYTSMSLVVRTMCRILASYRHINVGFKEGWPKDTLARGQCEMGSLDISAYSTGMKLGLRQPISL